jgi:hypothetical protein
MVQSDGLVAATPRPDAPYYLADEEAARMEGDCAIHAGGSFHPG